MNILKTFEWSYYSHFETIGVHISHRILENFRSFEKISPLDVRRLGDIFSKLPHWPVYTMHVDR